jgi:hypothetical protein
MFFAAAVTAVTVAGMVTVASAPAQAAAGCYGDYCSGKDPSTTGTNNNPCQNGARTVAWENLDVWRVHAGTDNGYWATVGVLELRWSDRCQTNWARLELKEATSLDRLHVIQSTNYRQSHKTSGWTSQTTTPGIFWTPMIYSPVAKCRAYVDGGAFRTDSTVWR